MVRTRSQFLIVLGLIAVLALAATAAGAAPKSSAHGGGGKGGGSTGGSGTVTLVMVNDANGNLAPNYGDSVTFRVTTTVTDRPYVRLDCYQGSAYVYSQWAGFYPDFSWPWLQTFVLSSSTWTSGGADCTATLYYYNGKGWADIMSTPVTVAA